MTPRGQLAIAFPADDEARAAWMHAIEIVRRSVMHLGIKEVAFWLDAAHTHVADAIHERERKVWHAHWSLVVLSLLRQRTDDVSRELLRLLADALIATAGLRTVEDEPLSPEEEAIALRRELAKFGDAGKQAIERVRKRGGRR